MKKNFLIMVIAAFIFTACSQKEQPKDTEVVATTEDNNISNDNTANKPLEAIYQSYFHLKEALVKGDGKEAQSSAESLYKNIKSVPMDKLSTEEHTNWMLYQDKLITDAEHIKDTDEIKHQRERFLSLSENMFELVKIIPLGKKVYYQNCPMYNDNKGGNWLSLEEKIANPYYGSEMLTCGSVLEVIQ